MKKLLFFLLILLSTNSYTQTWNLQMVNPGVINGPKSILYDDAGNPVIFYAIRQKILFSEWNGTSWKSKVLADFSYQANQFTWYVFKAIKLDTSYYLLFDYSFYVQPNFAYNYYCYQISSNGTVIKILNPGSFDAASLIGKGTTAYLAYSTSGNLYIKNLDITNNNWSSSQIVDGSGTIGGYELDLTSDNNGRIWICYFDNVGRNLKVARSKSNSDWDVWSVDTGGDVGQYSQIWVDDNNIAHVAYYDATNKKLKYATFNP